MIAPIQRTFHARNIRVPPRPTHQHIRRDLSQAPVPTLNPRPPPTLSQCNEVYSTPDALTSSPAYFARLSENHTTIETCYCATISTLTSWRLSAHSPPPERLDSRRHAIPLRLHFRLAHRGTTRRRSHAMGRLCLPVTNSVARNTQEGSPSSKNARTRRRALRPGWSPRMGPNATETDMESETWARAETRAGDRQTSRQAVAGEMPMRASAPAAAWGAERRSSQRLMSEKKSQSRLCVSLPWTSEKPGHSTIRGIKAILAKHGRKSRHASQARGALDIWLDTAHTHIDATQTRDNMQTCRRRIQLREECTRRCAGGRCC